MIGKSAWFWDSSFWLPPGITWNDIMMKQDKPGAEFAKPRHLLYSLFFLGLVRILHVISKNGFSRPLGSYYLRTGDHHQTIRSEII